MYKLITLVAREYPHYTKIETLYQSKKACESAFEILGRAYSKLRNKGNIDDYELRIEVINEADNI